MAKHFIAYVSTDDQRAPSVSRQGAREVRTRSATLSYGDQYEIETYLYEMNDGKVVASVAVKFGDRILHEWNSNPVRPFIDPAPSA